MHFQHSKEIRADSPDLVAGTVLARGPEAAFPEIQAWRRTFSRMGLKPTPTAGARPALGEPAGELRVLAGGVAVQEKVTTRTEFSPPSGT